MVDDSDPEVLDTLQRMAALQSRVCYMNVDRTLATWTRTALALIVFGTVVDRYGVLLLLPHADHVGTLLAPNPVSSAGGLFLIALGTFIVVAAAIRHEGYRKFWHLEQGRDESFGPWLAFPFAVMVAILGSVLLAVLLLITVR